MPNGGELIGRALADRGVRFVFTLCGGHISPILVGAKANGIRIVDVRHEATAVFAADAVARLTGTPGVAAVTAGPGVTNSITAVKNAQMAQSPVVLFGGATGTILKGRGALQDIEQLDLFRSLTKWSTTVRRVRELPGVVDEAFRQAASGVPGPVFVECPLDLLYDEKLVRDMYGARAAGAGGKSWRGRLEQWYLRRHVERLFRGPVEPCPPQAGAVRAPVPNASMVGRAADLIAASERPVMLVGSQATLDAPRIAEVAGAVNRLGLPIWLSGMARGLLGRGHRLQLRHQRRKALREADLVLLVGVPCDFRLDYGRQIRRSTRLITINRSARETRRNRRPTLGVVTDPGRFLQALADRVETSINRGAWLDVLRQRDDEREAEIDGKAAAATEGVNPVGLCREIDAAIGDDSVLVADGGDFVGTASYTVIPRTPLSWLDPGAFGTLGVGGGFALGAKLCRPDAEVWVLYGDGSVGLSLSELDSFVRHGLPVIAVVGNDASWAQIARDQVDLLGDDVATVLRYTDYDRVAEGWGGKGFRLDDPARTAEVLQAARAAAAAGHPVLINAVLGKSDFRKGSISV